ncbi:MFS transporter [Paracidovorax wautersii]|uniref:MFS transporter n=1 Tax=Paracidovorax wautersii TaxID=1177982 RepID=UPI0031E13998
MSDSRAGAQPTADVGRLLDDGAFSGFQKLVVCLAALSIVMDGFDGQLIGFALPSLIQEWGITRNAFAPAVAAGLVGMGIGSACAGLFADRFGRRWAVIGSVFVFGVATSLISLSPDVGTIAILRFFAGLGIGGALPSSTTMTAEFSPARRRTLAVTATIVCVPLGGMLAGLFAGLVLPHYGWRGLFLFGGLIPVAFSVVLFFTIPESPRYLARHPRRWDELRTLLARMSRPVAPGTQFADLREQQGPGAASARTGFGALFANGLARDTLALWIAFFMNLLTVYSAFSWLPTMLAGEGLSPSVAGEGLTAYNIGGVFGALLCAVVIGRFGSRRPLLLCCLAAMASALFLRSLDIKSQTALLVAGIGVHGMFVNAVQCAMYALCAYIYPTEVRATGTASALAFGRLGAILSAFAGAILITQGGASAYLAMLAAAMLLVFFALLAVRRHIPRIPRP